MAAAPASGANAESGDLEPVRDLKRKRVDEPQQLGHSVQLEQAWIRVQGTSLKIHSQNVVRSGTKKHGVLHLVVLDRLLSGKNGGSGITHFHP